jgi:hypothetical protein
LDAHQPDVVFQQDGAPPRWAPIVREFLDMHFPGRWVGRDGPTPWPPRSPEITSLDLFLWGYVKDIVYKTPVTSFVERNSELLLQSKLFHRKNCRTLGRKLNTAGTSYVAWKARVLKLFSTLQY